MRKSSRPSKAPHLHPTMTFSSSPAFPSRPEYAPPSNKEVTPIEPGIEWVSGLGPRNRDYKCGDTFAKKLRSHRHIQENIKIIINGISNECKKDCSYKGPYNDPFLESDYDLGGIGGIGKYIKDYASVITFGILGNLAVAFIGSYAAKFEVTNINCCKNTADLKITLENCSHAASALRPPVVGYTDSWQKNIAPIINGWFKNGPGSPTTQKVVLKEKLKLSTKCASK